MDSLFSLPRETKRRLSYYGIGSFTGLMTLSAILPPIPFYAAVSFALLGGAAGLIGLFAPERRHHQPTLVFVSHGGTCRDPMAKVITEALLKGREPAVRICATALVDSGLRRASRAARHVVKEQMGADLLKNHLPMILDQAIVSDADLILTMNDDHANEIRKIFPAASAKTHSLLGFLGKSGAIEDPWNWKAPDQMDQETIARYRLCFRTLHKILSENVEAIYADVIA